VKLHPFIAVFLTASAIGLTTTAARAEADHTAPKAWLAQPAAPAFGAPSPSSTGVYRSLAVLGSLALVAGGALMARKKWARGVQPGSHPRLSVLDTVRVAERSHVVLVKVGERCLLLGVTSHSVRRIAWLRLTDGPATSPPDSDAGAAANDSEVGDRDAFPGLLRQAFAQDPAAPALADTSPASIIAAATKDNVDAFTPRTTHIQPRSPSTGRSRTQGTGRASRATTPEGAGDASVESQASGLTARRRR
jgi:flagellar biogenesis protein FliO